MQNKHKSDLEVENLTGPITSITTINNNFFRTDDKWERNDVYCFDKKNIITYNNNCDILNEICNDSLHKFTSKIIFKYNELGIKISADFQDSNDDLITKSCFIYHDNGDITEMIEDTKISYTYNSRGYLIKELWFGPNIEQQSKHTYKYDSKGNIIEWIDHDEFDPLIYFFEFDEYNNVILKNVFSTNGSLREEYFYEYQYDVYNCWNKKAEIQIEGRKILRKTETIREIRYN